MFLRITKDFYDSNSVVLGLTEFSLFLWLKMAKDSKIEFVDFWSLIEKCL